MSVIHTSLLAISVAFLTVSGVQAAPAPALPTPLQDQLYTSLGNAQIMCADAFENVKALTSAHTTKMPRFWDHPRNCLFLPFPMYPKKCKQLKELRLSHEDYERTLSQFTEFMNERTLMIMNKIKNYAGTPDEQIFLKNEMNNIVAFGTGCKNMARGLSEKLDARYKLMGEIIHNPHPTPEPPEAPQESPQERN